VPTSRGWGLLAGGALLAGLARLTGAAELLVLAVPALGLPLLAWAWSRVPFRVRARRWIEPATVERLQPCIGVLTVTNLRSRRSPRLEVVDRREGRDIPMAIPRLAPGASHPTTYHLSTQRRGVFTLGPLTARRGDPFGLAESADDLGGRMMFSVYPRTHRLESLPGGLRASLDGSAQQIPFGSSVFHGLRDYIIGDDHRKIHWLSTARAGTPQVRVYRDSSVPTVTLLLDDRAASYAGDRFEDAVEVAASMVDLVARHDLAIVITTVSGAQCGTLGEPVDREDVLDFLTRLDPAPEEDLRLFDPRVQAPSSTVLLVTGALDADDGADLLQLRATAAGLMVCAVVPHPAKVAVPDGTSFVTLTRAEHLPQQWEEAIR
jgi:uncharacterized protein (DUF58 family)